MTQAAEENYFTNFWGRIKTNTPTLIAFIGVLAFLMSLVVGILVAPSKAMNIVFFISTLLIVGLLILEMYVVNCVQEGKCYVLSYFLACGALLVGISALLTALHFSATPFMTVQKLVDMPTTITKTASRMMSSKPKVRVRSK